MMRRTRICAVMLALLLVLPYGIVGAGSSASAANTSNSRYYYSQLKDDAKGFYDAMYEMYVQGIFKTGIQDYNLVEKGHITSEQLAAYEGRKEELLKLFGAARDASAVKEQDDRVNEIVQGAKIILRQSVNRWSVCIMLS